MSNDMSVKWTKEQQAAIEEKGKNILVAAAAGSGKTAVLVERIIHKITKEHPPVDLDRLLIVTFTNAAAQEMRQRIAKAIEEAVQNDPSNYHLRRQQSLLNKALISTLHSFCLHVLRKYYYVIDLDPKFRLADEVEMALLKEEVLDALLEDYYGQEDEEFFAVVDAYSNDRGDDLLRSALLDIHTFSKSHPFPTQWLDEQIKHYEMDYNSIAELPFYKEIEQDIQDQLTQAIDELKKGLAVIDGDETFTKYKEYGEQLLDSLEEAIESKSFQEYREHLQVSFGNLPRISKCENKEAQDAFKKYRKNAEDIKKSLLTDYFLRKEEDYLQDYVILRPMIRMFVSLVNEFDKRLEQKKKEKNMYEFQDLEHYALKILAKEGSTIDQLIPTDIALIYREYLEEVLVDEYQDSVTRC